MSAWLMFAGSLLGCLWLGLWVGVGMGYRVGKKRATDAIFRNYILTRHEQTKQEIK